MPCLSFPFPFTISGRRRNKLDRPDRTLSRDRPAIKSLPVFTRELLQLTTRRLADKAVTPRTQRAHLIATTTTLASRRWPRYRGVNNSGQNSAVSIDVPVKCSTICHSVHPPTPPVFASSSDHQRTWGACCSDTSENPCCQSRHDDIASRPNTRDKGL